MTTDTESSDLIHHYTDIGALCSIVQSNTIRLTHIGYLNDIKEVTHFFEVFDTVLLELSPDLDPEYLEVVRGELRNSFEISNVINTYIISFSKSDDELSQWRGYGNGVQIGFDRDKLFGRVKGLGFMLADCIYDFGDEVKDLIRNQITEGHTKHAKGEFNVDEFAFDLFSTSSLVKHGKFHEENEVRLVYQQPIFPSANPLEVKLREKGSSIVPYVEVELGDLDVGYPIVQFRFGPGQEASKQEKAIKIFYRQGSNPAVRYLSSNVPFRT